MIQPFPAEKIRILRRAVAQKRELRQLTPLIIEQEIERYLQQEGRVRRELEYNFHPRAAVFHTIIKEIRSRLRRSYGLFQHKGKEKKRKELLKKIFHATPPVAMEIIKEILESHASTKERLLFYRELYAKIFAITGKPATILDLGCGMNPFSLPYMKLKTCHYYAYDIGEEDLTNINEFFYWWGKQHPTLQGRADIFDLLRSEFSLLPRADICFLFKVTDIVDQGKGHKATEKAMLDIPAKYIVLSFSTVTMSGKPMTAPRRSWVELLCNRLGFFFSVITFPTEIFYVIRKENQNIPV